MALMILKNIGWRLSDENIRNGLNQVVKNTNLRGRWEVLQENPMLVLDTAHNEHAIQQVVQQILKHSYESLHLVLGFVNDKDVLSILKYFPKDAQYYFCSPNIPRRLEIEDLNKIIPSNLNARYFNSVDEAIQNAKLEAMSTDFIYVGGSTFVVAEAL